MSETHQPPATCSKGLPAVNLKFNSEVSDVSPISRLPLELVEVVVMKSALSMCLALWKVTSRVEEYVYLALTAVSYSWAAVFLRRRWFRNKLFQQLIRVCLPYHHHVQPAGNLESNGKGVKGICQLSDRLYLIRDGCNIVLIHQSILPFLQLQDLEIKELKSPQDIAACSNRELIYVTDGVNNCVWRVGADYTVDKWMTAVGPPFTLAVSEEKVLLAGVTDELPTLNIFNPDGSLAHRVVLPSDMVDLKHALSLTRGGFVVSHGQLGEDSTTQGCLVEVNKDGHVLKTYTDCKVWGRREKLSHVAHMAIDPEGRLIVTDVGSSKVMLFDAKLRLQRVLLSPDHDGVCQPQRLCYVHQTGYLFIGMAIADAQIYHIRQT